MNYLEKHQVNINKTIRPFILSLQLNDTDQIKTAKISMVLF
jgi:hypothetical protein